MQSYKPQLNQKFKYNTMITQSNCIENILNYRNNHLSSKLKGQSIFKINSCQNVVLTFLEGGNVAFSSAVPC